MRAGALFPLWIGRIADAGLGKARMGTAWETRTVEACDHGFIGDMHTNISYLRFEKELQAIASYRGAFILWMP